ncbi:hypothetical protein [Alteromonas oceanisediminis]|uniref:hypothetical protein n=1 Tax=Alteromonas oceanisediminis TaxID=2836180 RepID=UPI001BDAADD6|nr:hypothetical protein [Alteromonas oceanisediminis]MBT0586695.1 hypothetical protein [Alteromonas oceanisediminis]
MSFERDQKHVSHPVFTDVSDASVQGEPLRGFASDDNISDDASFTRTYTSLKRAYNARKAFLSAAISLGKREFALARAALLGTLFSAVVTVFLAFSTWILLCVLGIVLLTITGIALVYSVLIIFGVNVCFMMICAFLTATLAEEISLRRTIALFSSDNSEGDSQ